MEYFIQNLIHCPKCDSVMSESFFDKNNKGKWFKNCNNCREILTESQKCVHDKRKSTCRECGGGSICEHDKIRTLCKECGGGSICEHGSEKEDVLDAKVVEYVSIIE